jgi:hypothetical protein
VIAPDHHDSRPHGRAIRGSRNRLAGGCRSSREGKGKWPPTKHMRLTGMVSVQHRQPPPNDMSAGAVTAIVLGKTEQCLGGKCTLRMAPIKTLSRQGRLGCPRHARLGIVGRRFRAHRKKGRPIL